MLFKNFYKKYPITFSVFFAFMFYLIVSLTFSILATFNLDFNPTKNSFLPFLKCILQLLILVGMVVFFNFSLILKSSIKSFKSSIKATSLTFVLMFVFLFFRIIGLIQQKQDFASSLEIATGVFTIFTSAFVEEVLFRGILANLLAFKYAKTKKGAYFTILTSSFVFGLSHFINLLTGAKFSAVFFQAITAFFIGNLIAIVYFKYYSNIWVISIWHTVLNCYGSFEIYFLKNKSSFVEVFNKEDILKTLGYRIFSFILLILICLFYLRKNAIERIIKNISEFKNEFFKPSAKF